MKTMEVEHSPRGFPHNSAKTLLRRSSGDIDYKDVFGGPPRLFSMPEVRRRYGGLVETAIEEDAESEEEDRVSTPVFGEEVTSRRRHPGGNFFDDIFGGDESTYVSPRNRDSDRNNLFGSSPNSTIMSPTKPKSEQYYGTSLPAQYSLPTKVNKAEFPAFASFNHGPYKMDSSINALTSPRSLVNHGQYRVDNSTNALISPRTSTTLSRFSSQAIRSQDEVRNREARLHHQSSLPHDACFRFEDPPNTVISNGKEISPHLKKDRKSFDGNGNQFYLSIYKWASGRGIPMMNLMGRNSSKSKDRIGKCASFNGRSESTPSITRYEDLFVHTEPEHFKMESKKKDSTSRDDEEKTPNSVEDAVLGAEDVASGATQNTKSKRRISKAEIAIKEKMLKDVLVKMNESPKSEVMPTLRSLLIAEAEKNGVEENNSPTTSKDHLDASKNLNKNEEISINVNSKSSLQAAAVDSELSPGTSVAMGKVKEFAQIFNREADSRTQSDVNERNETPRWKAMHTDQKMDVKLNAEKVDENLKKTEAWHTQRKKTPTTERDNLSANQNATSSSDSFPRDSMTSMENSDESLVDNFMVEHLSDGIEEVTHSSEGLEHIKAIDVKIQQWSTGKQGNIRSLLSTLQYVLWPGSGWNPIPLVELIEANSVKRAYQKALLRLHPDKLRQNSTASHHKYTAEKIFDILQEAWDDFNTLAPL